MSDWRLTLLSLDGTRSEDVETAFSGSLSWDTSRDVQGAATLTVTGLDHDWLHHRVRIFRGDTAVFTGIVTDSPEDHDDGTVDVSVSLMDLTGIPAGDLIPFVSGVPDGSNPLERAAAFLADYGMTVALPESAAELQAPITWPANTPNLTRINSLLAAAGCTNLYATGMGTLGADPLLPIDQAPVVATYSATDVLYLPRWSRNRDVYRVPNRVIATSRTPGGSSPLDVTVDLPATSQYSFDRTGRRVVRDMGEIDAADLTILTALATRDLESSQAVVETRTITHEWVPGIRVGNVVEHTHHLVPSIRSRVVSQRIDMTPDGLVEAVMEGVS